MPNQENRKYRHADIVMLTASSTIVENATLYKKELIAKRATWDDPFLSNLKSRIETLIQTYIGVDSAKELRNASQSVAAIQTKALQSLSLFKTQVDQDFKKVPIRKAEILNVLGFNTYYFDAYKNKSQDALINILYQFKKNIDVTLKAEITSKGTDAASIDEIVSYAEALKNANVKQETFKSNRPAITDEAIAAFNDLYDDIISLSKISAKILSSNKAAKESFSYSKLANAQQAALKAKKVASNTNG